MTLALTEVAQINPADLAAKNLRELGECTLYYIRGLSFLAMAGLVTFPSGCQVSLKPMYTLSALSLQA